MVESKSFLFLTLTLALTGCGAALPAPCDDAQAPDAPADVLEAGALDAPEGGPLTCWQCEPVGAVGAYNACTKTFLEACESCDVFGPACTPSACAACPKDAASE